MDRAVAGRGVAYARRHVVILRSAFGHNLHAGANAVAVALGSAQSDIEPVAGLLAAVHPDFGVLAESSYDHIDTAVAIQITEGAAAMAGRRSRFEACFFGQSHPFSAGARIAKDGIRLVDFLSIHRSRLDVATAHEQILPSVIIEII